MKVAFPIDFVDAHYRHWRDGEELYHQRRWANADQLYGFSAECGLKAVMKGMGMSVRPDGRPGDSKHAKHVQDLWPVFMTFAQNRNGARYVNMLPPSNPFSMWSHHNRYANSRHFSQASVSPHRAGASRVCGMVDNAKQDGLSL